jgi:hypothetical protein
MVNLRKKSRNWMSPKKKNFDFSKTVEFLVAKLSSLQKDISSKQHAIFILRTGEYISGRHGA